MDPSNNPKINSKNSKEKQAVSAINSEIVKPYFHKNNHNFNKIYNTINNKEIYSNNN